MTREAVLQVLHRGRPLAVSLPATDQSRFGWIAVYPLDLKRRGSAEFLHRIGIAILKDDEPIYRIRKFEVKRSLIAENASLSEEDLANKDDSVAIGDDNLEARLKQFGVALEQLDLPFKSEYPI